MQTTCAFHCSTQSRVFACDALGGALSAADPPFLDHQELLAGGDADSAAVDASTAPASAGASGEACPESSTASPAALSPSTASAPSVAAPLPSPLSGSGPGPGSDLGLSESGASDSALRACPCGSFGGGSDLAPPSDMGGSASGGSAPAPDVGDAAVGAREEGETAADGEPAASGRE